VKDRANVVTTAAATQSITVVPTNDAPTISFSPASSVNVYGFTTGEGGDVLRFDISDLQTLGAVVTNGTIKLAHLAGSKQIIPGNAVILSLVGFTTLTDTSTAISVTSTFASVAEVIDALGSGGLSSARQLRTAAISGVTAGDTIPIIWGDGANSNVGLLRFVNAVADDTDVADADLAIHTVATLVGISNPSTVINYNIQFVA
jgi:hypothetical protein